MYDEHNNANQKDQLQPNASLVKIGGLGEFHRGKGIPRSDLSDEGFPCLRYGEIYSTYGNTISSLKSRVVPEAASLAQTLKTGDIVFTEAGETAAEIGKAAAYIGPEPAYVGSHTIILRYHQQDPIFLAHALNSEHARRQKVRFGKGHSVVHIHVSDLSKVEIFLPSLSEQRTISDILRVWDEAIEKFRTLHDATVLQKHGLMQKLLTGEWRVNSKRVSA